MIKALSQPFDCSSDDDSEVSSPFVQKIVKKKIVKKAPKVKSQTTKKRWRWTEEMGDHFVALLSNIKVQMESQSKDFEADLVKLYTKLRELMAQTYEEDFGPVKITPMSDNLSEEELVSYKANATQEKAKIKIGYERIKQKTKDLRQDYRKAVNEGTRSGSGKLVIENWDTLKTIWAGSPATTCIKNSVSSHTPEESQDLDFANANDLEDLEYESSKEEQEILEKDKKRKVGTAKFVDDKRRMLEKSLSASQRDQIYLNVARDELKVKEALAENLKESMDNTSEAMRKVAESIASVGKNIGDGLAMLANAFSNQQQPTSSNQQQPHQMQYSNQVAFNQWPGFVSPNSSFE